MPGPVTAPRQETRDVAGRAGPAAVRHTRNPAYRSTGAPPVHRPSAVAGSMHGVAPTRKVTSMRPRTAAVLTAVDPATPHRLLRRAHHDRRRCAIRSTSPSPPWSSMPAPPRVAIAVGDGPVTVTEEHRYSRGKPSTAYEVQGQTLRLTESGCQDDNARCDDPVHGSGCPRPCRPRSAPRPGRSRWTVWPGTCRSPPRPGRSRAAASPVTR